MSEEKGAASLEEQKHSSSSGSSGASQNKSSSNSGGSSSQSTDTIPVPNSQQSPLELEDDFGADNVWGIFMPVNSMYYSRHDFTNDQEVIKFGRHKSCDCIIGPKTGGGAGFDINVEEEGILMNQMSSLHFQIERRLENSNYVVYIIDKSSNGTFVNSEKLIKNKPFPLINGAVVSMSLVTNRAYFYIDAQAARKEKDELPYEFKQKYIIEQIVLGEGAVGLVKRGIEKSTYKKVAIKIIKKSKSLSVVNDLTYEASVMKSIEHENIVKVLDVYEDVHKVWMVIEYLEGGDLFTRIRDNSALDENLCRKWFSQILNAVGHLHSKNIVHRDLKPENILLSSSEEDDNNVILKVTDFNLSRFVSEESLGKTIVGTPMYLAPEIANPLVIGYTHLVDCWSLGCILYVMLSGRAPFNPDKELVPQIRAGSYRFPTAVWGDISSNAKDLIRKLIDVDPDKRWDVTEALQHDWFRLRAKVPQQKRERDEEEASFLKVLPDEKKLKSTSTL